MEMFGRHLPSLMNDYLWIVFVSTDYFPTALSAFCAKQVQDESVIPKLLFTFSAPTPLYRLVLNSTVAALLHFASFCNAPNTDFLADEPVGESDAGWVPPMFGSVP